MAGRKTTAKSPSATNGKSNGHHAKGKTGTTVKGSPRRARPSADELALRAWRTTYNNNHKGKEA
jgi:hypothetical protein